MDYYAEKVKTAYKLDRNYDLTFDCGVIDVNKFNNLRRLNRELETIVSNKIGEIELKTK